MKIEKICNLVGVQEFKSKKDETKVFHNATFLADDLTIKCQFIKNTDFEILNKMNRLQEVNCEFDLYVSGTDSSGAPAYSMRLSKVIWNQK